MSQERLPGWNVPEDATTMDDFSITCDSNIGLQHNIHSQAMSENLSHLSPAQGIQGQGMWASFETGEPYDTFPIAENCPLLNRNSCCLSIAGAVPDFATTSCPGSDFIAADSEIGPNFFAQQLPYPRMSHDCSDQSLLLSGGNFEYYGQSMGGQPVAEQSHLNHFPTASLGVDDLHQASEFQSIFSQLHDPLYGGVPVDSQMGTPSFPQSDLAQPSFSSFSLFDTSDTTALALNCDRNLDASHSNHDIYRDMSIQWNSTSYLGNNSMTAPSTNPAQEIGSFENPIEITESPESAPKSQLSSTIVDRKHPLSKSFGPSRPIPLPPARRGGRKGKLSTSELKALRESRKKGVCIRCRKMKEKCHGGFPCKPCRENSNAILWKFPCTKAQFLDLLECGSYFEDVETYQIFVIDKIDQKCFIQQAEMIMSMVHLGRFGSEITARFPGIVQFPLTIDWSRGLAAIEVILERLSQTRTSVPSRQIIEIPYTLAHSELSQPPISIDFIDLSETEMVGVLIMKLFCAAHFTITETLTNADLPPEMVEVVENNVAKVFEKTVKLLLWISRRYYEVMIFRSLQDATNRMNSLSTDELSEIARILLEVLKIGSLEICKAEDSFLYKINSFTIERERAYYDRKKNIRQALFIYFSITLDKLPAWYDFWSLERNKDVRWFLDISKHHLTSLEAFDRYYRRESMRVRIHMNLLKEGEITSEGVREPSGTLGEILSRPQNVKAELKAIQKRLSEHHQPNIESFERILSARDRRLIGLAQNPYHAPLLEQVKLLGLLGRRIRQAVEKVLGEQLGSEEPRENGEVESLIKQALDFTATAEKVCSDLKMIMRGILKRLKDIRNRMRHSISVQGTD